MPWMAGMPKMQEQFSAMPWMAGMPATQEQLPAMASLPSAKAPVHCLPAIGGQTMYQVSLRESYFPAQHDDVVRETTVGGVLVDAAEGSPEAPALLEARGPSRPSMASGALGLLPGADGTTGRSWTYRELRADAERLADALLSRFEPGERIAIWSPNTPEWAIVEFGAALAGLTLVTVNPAYQAKELAYVLQQSRSVGLFLVAECRGNPLAEIARDVRNTLPKLREVIDLDDHAALFAKAGASRPRPDVRPNDPA